MANKGGQVCAIATCNNTSVMAKNSGIELSFFCFPEEEKLRQFWMHLCNKTGQISTKTPKICGKHFRRDDFEDGLKAELLGLVPKKLKKNVVPSIGLPDEVTELVPKLWTEYQKKLSKSNEMPESFEQCANDHNIVSSNVQIAPKRDADCFSIKSYDQGCSEVASPNSAEKLQELKIKYDRLIREKQEVCENLEKRVKYLEEENILLSKKRAEDFKHSSSKIRKLKEDNAAIKLKLLEADKKLKAAGVKFELQAKVAFKDFLTANQVDIALKKKTKAWWNQEELSKAFTLRYLGIRSYVFLRDTLKYPLPGISTLQHWASTINLKSGALEDVFSVMDAVGRSKTDFERVTALSFDEMKVTAEYEYDKQMDEVLGPHNYMQVVMARGIFDKWKQPIYIGFDKKMTKEILENLIIRLNKINYNVVACISDCGGGNQGLWKVLGITPEQTSAPHPVTNEPIYFFADVPHLLKLTRNWFLDTGFVLNDGTRVNSEPLKKLIEVCQTEVSSCHKLRDTHITCEKTQRQNVRLAAELFSHTTATALNYYEPGEDKELAKRVGDVFEIINNWFDVMNSYTPTAALSLKKPYGLCLNQQDEALEKMKKFISGMLCCGKVGIQVFQKGILISTNSLQGLFRHLKNKYQNMAFILTHRVNQDFLENFFSQVRTRGGLHDHPSPLNALYRIRMIILGKNPGMVQARANVSTNKTEQGEYLFAAALNKASLVTTVTEPSSIIDEILESSSSSTSSSISSLNPSANAFERDGLIFLAGWLARKHKKTYPHLGQYTYIDDQKRSVELETCALPSWLTNLSFGGLTQPSDEWFAQVEQMEKYFLKYHKSSFYVSKKVVLNTMEYIANKIEMPSDLLKSFCSIRIFIRIKFLNFKRILEKEQKRKDRGTKRNNLENVSATSSKIQKKMRRIVQ